MNETLRTIGDIIVSTLAAIGVFTTAMFLLGYLWATYVPERTCTPDFIDRMFR